MEASQMSPKSVVFWRHVIGVLIALVFLPPYQWGLPSEFLGGVMAKAIVTFGCAGAIATLGILFLTNTVRPKAWFIFIVCAWTFAFIGSAVMWYGQEARAADVPNAGIPHGTVSGPSLAKLRKLAPNLNDYEIADAYASGEKISIGVALAELGLEQLNDPGFFTSIKRGLSSYPVGLGRLARDFTKSGTPNALELWGEEVAIRNPSS